MSCELSFVSLSPHVTRGVFSENCVTQWALTISTFLRFHPMRGEPKILCFIKWVVARVIILMIWTELIITTMISCEPRFYTYWWWTIYSIYLNDKKSFEGLIRKVHKLEKLKSWEPKLKITECSDRVVIFSKYSRSRYEFTFQ